MTLEQLKQEVFEALEYLEENPNAWKKSSWGGWDPYIGMYCGCLMGCVAHQIGIDNNDPIHPIGLQLDERYAEIKTTHEINWNLLLTINDDAVDLVQLRRDVETWFATCTT